MSIGADGSGRDRRAANTMLLGDEQAAQTCCHEGRRADDAASAHSCEEARHRD